MPGVSSHPGGSLSAASAAKFIATRPWQFQIALRRDEQWRSEQPGQVQSHILVI